MRDNVVAILVALLAAIGAVTLTGCKSADSEDQLLLELANQDKQSIYDRAEELYVAEEYADSRKYFSFIYDTFPNDPLGHKAALRIADTYATKNDTASLTEARLRYRDFANRYPNDPDRDYALLMLGQTYAANRKRPDRDLSTLQESMGAYNQLIALYPDSPHVGTAREAISELREILAEHEFQVATFYSRNRYWRGVMWRLEYLKEKYPEYSRIEEAEELLAEATAVINKREEAIAKFRESLKKKAEENSANTDSENPDDSDSR